VPVEERLFVLASVHLAVDFELSPEQRLIQDTVRSFVDERVLPNAIENDIAHRLDMDVIEGWPSSGSSGS
jgi:hypothetical protein